MAEMQATEPEMSGDWITQGMGNVAEGLQYVQKKGISAAPSFACFDDREMLSFRKELTEPFLRQRLDWFGTLQMRLDALVTSNCQRLLAGYLGLGPDFEKIRVLPNLLGIERPGSHSLLADIVHWYSGRQSLRVEKLGVALA